MSIIQLEFRHLKDQGLFAVRNFLDHEGVGTNVGSGSESHGTRSDPSPVVLPPSPPVTHSAARLFEVEVDKATD